WSGGARARARSRTCPPSAAGSRPLRANASVRGGPGTAAALPSSVPQGTAVVVDELQQPADDAVAARADPVVLPLVRDPRLQVADRGRGLQLQPRVDVEVVEVDRGRDRHLVRGEPLAVVERIPVPAPDERIRRGAEGTEEPDLLEHPGVHHLAGEAE